MAKWLADLQTLATLSRTYTNVIGRIERTDFDGVRTRTEPAFDARVRPADDAGIKEFRIPMSHETIEISRGVRYTGWTFGHTVPGPVIRARQGDLDLHLVETEFDQRRFRRAGGRPARRSDSAGGLSAPMPGRVRKVLAAPGDRVARGDAVLILEAMKMEHAIRAPRDGTVTKIFPREGDLVEAGAVLADIQ